MSRSRTLLLLLLLPALAACAARGGPARLANTYGRLVELDGQAAMGTPGPREAHLQFAVDSARVSGSTGCNRLSGAFTLEGESLRFGPAAVTRMACLDPGANRQEQTFLAALSGTQRHRFAGDTLVLEGVNGVLARLVATDR